MKLRSVIFWTHLSIGVVAGLVILFLSITGALLTYEHEITKAYSSSETATPAAGQALLTADEMAAVARERAKGAMVILLDYENRADAPVVVHPIGGAGMHEMTLNPYTGEDFAGASDGAKTFFEVIVGWHRWLGAQGSGIGTGRMVTGAANLLFAFLLLSGIYLWLPRVWKWALLRPKMLFRRNPGNTKARDYNWHHVFSFWALIPLFLIVGSAVIISYPWANAAFYRAYGADAPTQGGPAFLGDLRNDAATAATVEPGTQLATLQDAVDAAIATNPEWTQVNLFVHPDANVPVARVIVHDGNGVLPEQMSTVVFDRRQATVTEIQTYDDLTPVEQGRMWIRFVHTGEQYGIVGSTIAGLASLAAAFLVYTGLALAIRRLLEHLQRRRRRLAQAQESGRPN